MILNMRNSLIIAIISTIVISTGGHILSLILLDFHEFIVFLGFSITGNLSGLAIGLFAFKKINRTITLSFSLFNIIIIFVVTYLFVNVTIGEAIKFSIWYGIIESIFIISTALLASNLSKRYFEISDLEWNEKVKSKS